MEDNYSGGKADVLLMMWYMEFAGPRDCSDKYNFVFLLEHGVIGLSHLPW